MTPATRRYVLVWVALAMLLAISAASSFLSLGWGNIAVNLGVAVMKAGLIAVFFMRLRHAIGAVHIAAFVTLMTLAVLVALVMADFLTR